MTWEQANNPTSGSFQPGGVTPNYAQMLTNLRSGGQQLGGLGGLDSISGGGSLGGLLTANPQTLPQAMQRQDVPRYKPTPYTKPVAAPGSTPAGAWDFAQGTEENPMNILYNQLGGGFAANQSVLEPQYSAYTAVGGKMTPYDWYLTQYLPAQNTGAMMNITA